jgi:hypothetical protein
MHTYNRANGNWSHNGELLGTGYSGNGEGLNNPAMSDVHNVGPIPAGRWSISQPFTDPGKGHTVMRLSPLDGTETFGRGGFLIHGDNEAMNHTASEGCIILEFVLRQMIAQSGDDELQVV